MRYVTNLIPEKARVLPAYFKSSNYAAINNSTTDALYWLAGTAVLVAAIINYNHFFLLVLLLVTGLLIIPPGHTFIERKLRFRFTIKLKLIFILLAATISTFLFTYYKKTDAEKAVIEQARQKRVAQLKAEEQQKEKERIDSFSYHITNAEHYVLKKKEKAALTESGKALSFAATAGEKAQVENIKARASLIHIKSLVSSAKYKSALSEINHLLTVQPSNKEVQYQQAVCLSKTGNTADAVAVLKSLINSGYTDAVSLHEKINPVRKRIAYYVTRCCDGSTSGSTGRGTCSHHGGVCNWREPVYEEYRKY